LVPTGISLKSDSTIVQKLGVSPVYLLHSLEILMGWSFGGSAAIEGVLIARQTKKVVARKVLPADIFGSLVH